jgi:hypothetical protein
VSLWQSWHGIGAVLFWSGPFLSRFQRWTFLTALPGFGDSPWAIHISPLRGSNGLRSFHFSPFTNSHGRFLSLVFDVAVDFGEYENGG